MTAVNKYDVVYDDYDEEEIGEAEFEILQDESQRPSCRKIDQCPECSNLERC